MSGAVILSVLVLLEPGIDIDGQLKAEEARPTVHERSENRRSAAPARGYHELRRRRPLAAPSAASGVGALALLRDPEEGEAGPSV